MFTSNTPRGNRARYGYVFAVSDCIQFYLPIYIIPTLLSCQYWAVFIRFHQNDLIHVFLSSFKGRISPFLFLKEKLFELDGIFTVAFIKYKNISTLLNVKTLFFFARRKQYFQHTCNNHGNFHALLYQTISSVWRFCYIKRRVGFFSHAITFVVSLGVAR